VDRIEDIIEQSAVRKTTTEGCGGDTTTQVPNNTYGWGRIDALAAVNLARAEAVPLVSIVSRKTHGNAGTIDLSLSAFEAVVEPRVGQPTAGSHTIVFTFANPLASVSERRGPERQRHRCEPGHRQRSASIHRQSLRRHERAGTARRHLRHHRHDRQHHHRAGGADRLPPW
jgi:hypothetical protein